MRGNKRRAAAFVTAANKSQPALNDAILDVANRKGMRCCVECGATSTPQWREGPMGPKTLCNACGVRRQRLLRKRQAATVGSVPTAPVAAVQARRRMAARSALQTPTFESDETPYGGISGSEHSSDETEVDWATATPTKPHLHLQQRQPQHHLQQQQPQQEVEESCNEDESAAYDLLFFAGVEQQRQPHQQQQHGHNTRRHVQPVNRSDDFYYYEEEAAEGVESGRAEDGSCKRRRVGVTPLHPSSRLRLQVRPWLVGSSLSSTEDAAESELASQLMVRASDSNNTYYTQQQQKQRIELQADERRQLTALPNCKIATLSPLTFPVAPNASAPAPSAGAAPPPSATPDAAAATAAFPPLFTLPVALPVLPLSLPLPSMPPASAKDYELLLKLQLDFQRACLQLHQANVQCEAVSAVVAEHRQAAASAHEQAAAASQQLAAEARAVADRYRLRDVLSELHSATAAEGRAAEAAGVGSATACDSGGVKQEEQQGQQLERQE